LKSAFEDQWEENSVNIKMNNFVGNIFCYQVHAPKTDTHIPSASLLCYFRCRNLSEVNCIE